MSNETVEVPLKEGQLLKMNGIPVFLHGPAIVLTHPANVKLLFEDAKKVGVVLEAEKLVDNESWGIRLTGHAQPSNGMVMASVEFNEAKFTHLLSQDRVAAGIALMRAATILIGDSLYGEEVPVIVVPLQCE